MKKIKYEWIEKLYWNVSIPEIEDKGDFGKFYLHLELVFVEGIAEVCDIKKEELPPFSQELINAFISHMQEISLRTLIFEMEVCEECGELLGDDEKEKYNFFANVLLTDENYLQELYREYPVMYTAMLNAIGDWIRNICEVLECFGEDKVGINQKFYKDNPCQKIETIDGGKSDRHNGGHRVYILELDNGQKIVYKPRSMAIDEKYRAFLQWIFEGIGVPFWWNKIWDRGQYGWSEWVSAEPCSTYEQLERYYQRNGILLCVSYLLGSEDLHYENLIAHGEYPVIIDLEMGIGSRGIQEATEEWSISERIYHESVLQTGLLPLYTWNEDGEGVNVGAINGMGGQLVPIMMPVVKNAGTVKMHVEYYQPTMGEGKNLATLQGEFIQPYEFLHKLEKGVEEAYCFFMNHKKQVWDMLALFQEVPVRYLIRETQQYSMMLLTAFHPDNLIGAVEKKNALVELVAIDNTEENPKKIWGWEQEIQELSRGDIPYFWYDVFGKALYSGSGATFSGYFTSPIINCVEDRLKRMNKTDMERQKKLMRTALLLGTKRKKPEQKNILSEENESDISQEDLETIVAERIGEILLKEALWSEDGKDVGWISIVMAGYRERGYLIRPMNLYLYDGLSGVAVFMAELAARTKKLVYQNVTDVITEKLFDHTNCLAKEESNCDLPTGAFSGEASIAFAYILLYETCKQTNILDYLYRQCKVIERMLSRDKTYDVLGGNAGAILVFLYAYELTGNNQYVGWAREAGDYLLEAASQYEWGIGWVNPLAGRALTGFAHGASGMMLALAKLSYYTGEECYQEAAYQAYCFEEHYYHEEWQDWEDLRYTEPDHEVKARGMAWCHGWGGIAMARILAEKYVTGVFKERLQQTSDFIQKKNIYEEESFCLCHGNIGNESLFFVEERYNEASVWREELVKKLHGFGENIQNELGIQECSNFGLLGGITGIGYGCALNERKILRLLSLGDKNG